MSALAVIPITASVARPEAARPRADLVPFEWHLGCAIRTAQFEASRRVGLSQIQSDEVEDFAQELLLHAIAKWSKFDYRRGRASTFLATIMRTGACSILRARNAQRRGGGRAPRPLDDDVACRLAAKDDQRDLRIDILAEITELPEDHQALAWSLVDAKSISAAARSVGLSGPVALAQFNAIRDAFLDAGLEP